MLGYRRRLRRLAAESLERRDLLAADPFGTNQLQPLDVTRDGYVTPFDALVVINALRESDSPGEASPADGVGRFIDVDGNGQASPGDVLAIINALSQRSPILAAKLSNDSAPPSDSALRFDLATNEYAIELNVSVSELTDQTVQLRIGDDSALFNDLTELFVDDQLVLSEEQIDQFFGEPLPDGDHRVTIQLREDGSVVQESDFELTVDRDEPSIESVFPKLSSLQGTRSIKLEFGGPIEELVFDSQSIQLVPRDGNSESLVPVSGQITAQGNTIEYLFADEIPVNDYELRIDEARLSTGTGNAVGASVRVSDFDVVVPTSVWTQPEGGSWDNPLHWLSGEVPEDGDVVSISLNADATVDSMPPALNLRHLSVTGGRLLVEGGVELTSGVVELEQAEMVLSGGTLSSALVTSATEQSSVQSSIQGSITVSGDSDLRGVTLELPATIQAGSTLTIRDGLTIQDSVSLEGTDNATAGLHLSGPQSILGAGSISLVGTTSVAARNQVWATGGEIVTLGPELELFAVAGELNSFENSEAPIDLRSSLNAAENGNLIINNLGAAEGILDLNLNAPLGTVRITNLADVTVNNSGSTPVTFADNALLTSVTVNSPIELDGHSLLVRDRLTINNTLMMRGIPANPAALSVIGSSVLDGIGTIVLDDGGGDTLGNRIISLPDPFVPRAGQVVIIESDLTIRGGSGMVSPGFSGGGGFDLRGTIATTEGGRISLDDVFSSGTLTLDSENGVVELTNIRNADLRGTSGSRVTVDSLQSWSNITLNLPVIIQPGQQLEVRDGLMLNSTIALLGDETGIASLAFTNDQTVSGSGSFIFSETASDPTQNVLLAENASLVLGPDVTVRGGNGSVLAQTDKPLLLQGTLIANEGDQLELSNLITAENTLYVEPQLGELILLETPSGIEIDGAEGAVLYTPEIVLDSATINIPLVFTESNRGLTVENGLTLNSVLRFTMPGSDLQFVGAQAINGVGDIEFETFDPDTTDGESVPGHAMTVNETDGEVTINSEITLRAGKLFMGQGNAASNATIRILGGFVDQNAQVTYDNNVVLFT